VKRSKIREKDRHGAKNEFYSKRVVIKNERGLHARCASKFVEIANKFSSRITVNTASGRSDGKSIMGILTLLASSGTVLTISAKGRDARDAVNSLSELVKNKFGEK